VIEWLESAYPNDAYKLIGNDGFQNKLLDAMKNYMDDEISNVMATIITHETRLPNIAVIKRYADEVRKAHRTQYYAALPQPEYKTSRMGIERIKAAFRRVINKKWKPPITPELRNYAKQLFPDMNDEGIAKNYNEFLGLMENGSRINGFPIRVRINKRTGCVEWWVHVPMTILRGKSSFDKYGKDAKNTELPF